MPLRDFASRYPAVVQRLMQAFSAHRLGHAYLISGDHAETIRGFAWAMIQACICERPGPDGDGCGDCLTCRRIEAEQQPNVQVVKPRSKSRQIRIDEIRTVERQLYLKSGGVLKVAVILDADCLNLEAQNAFLKTLEEPGADTLLMLVSVNPNALLPTVRSRCQQLSLLDNRLDYTFDDFPELAAALGPMRAGAGALVASRSAAVIQALLDTRKADAETEAKAMVRAARDEMQNLDGLARKQLEEEIEARAASAYRQQRETLLSAVLTWFSQEYLRATGVPADLLPNPEFYQVVGELSPPDEAAALRGLNLAKELVAQLSFNVDEALGITTFCQDICSRA